MAVEKRGVKQQFSSFVIAGIITTIFQYLILIALVEFNVLSPVYASACGACGGAVLSYILNKKYTFQSQANHTRAAPKFFIVAVIAISANAIFMYLFVTLAGIPYIPAQIITTGAIIPITFGLNKIWSFAETN